jgi:ABC-type transport system involved in multi-copper enzyme maturation permease subunit
MKLSNFLVVKAVISLAFGIAFALIPAAAMSLYGVTLDPAGIVMARYFGACLIGIGLICWLDRSADPQALQGITLALCIGDTVGFIVALQAQLSGLNNALGWANVVLWLLLALGLGYFRFLKPSAS